MKKRKQSQRRERLHWLGNIFLFVSPNRTFFVWVFKMLLICRLYPTDAELSSCCCYCWASCVAVRTVAGPFVYLSECHTNWQRRYKVFCPFIPCSLTDVLHVLCSDSWISPSRFFSLSFCFHIFLQNAFLLIYLIPFPKLLYFWSLVVCFTFFSCFCFLPARLFFFRRKNKTVLLATNWKNRGGRGMQEGVKLKGSSSLSLWYCLWDSTIYFLQTDREQNRYAQREPNSTYFFFVSVVKVTFLVVLRRNAATSVSQ